MKNPATSMPIFSSANYLLDTFTRNVNLWSKRIVDRLASVMVKEDQDDQFARGGVLITPRHILWQAGLEPVVGTIVTFVSPGNTITQAELLSVVSDDDFTLGLLSVNFQDLGYTPLPIITVGENELVRLKFANHPLLCVSQYNKATGANPNAIKDQVCYLTNIDHANGNDNKYYSDFTGYEQWSGDNGSPQFIVYNDQIYLFGFNTNSGTDGVKPGDYKNSILSLFNSINAVAQVEEPLFLTHSEIVDSTDLVQSYVNESKRLPKNIYHVKRQITLSDNQKIDLQSGAVINTLIGLNSPAILIDGSDVEIHGRFGQDAESKTGIDGSVPIRGWQEEGELWSAPWAYFWQNHSLVKDGVDIPISSWPKQKNTGALTFSRRHKLATIEQVVESDPSGNGYSDFLQGSWTMATWVKRNYNVQNQSPLQIGGEKSAAAIGFYEIQGQMQLGYRDGAVNKALQIFPGHGTTRWQLLVASYNHVTKKLSYWINDMAEGDGSHATLDDNLPDVGSDPLVIGGNFRVTNSQSDMEVSFVGLWSSVLTEEQRIELFNGKEKLYMDDASNGLTGSCLSWYDFMDPQDPGFDMNGYVVLTPRNKFFWTEQGLSGVFGGITEYKGATHHPTTNTWKSDMPLPATEAGVFVSRRNKFWVYTKYLNSNINAEDNTLYMPSNNYRLMSAYIENIKATMQPGEWCHKLSEGKIYYKPLPGEEINNIKFTVPYSQLAIHRSELDGSFAMNDGMWCESYPVLSNIHITEVGIRNFRQMLGFSTGSTVGYRAPGSYCVDLHSNVNNVAIDSVTFYNLSGYLSVQCCGPNSNDVLFANNLITNCWGGGVAVNTRSMGLTGNQVKLNSPYRVYVQDNEMKNNGWKAAGEPFGVFIGLMHDSIVEGNEIHGSGQGGIGVVSVHSMTNPDLTKWSQRVNNLTITRNHIYDSASCVSDAGGIYIFVSCAINEESLISDNLIEDIYSCFRGSEGDTQGIFIDRDRCVGWTIDGNIIACTTAIPMRLMQNPFDLTASTSAPLRFYVKDNVCSSNFITYAKIQPLDGGGNRIPEVVSANTTYGPNDLWFSLTAGVPGQDDGMLNNIGYDHPLEMEAIIADWPPELE